MEKQIELIKKFSNAFGPSGHEDEVVEIAKEELNFMEQKENKIRNLYLSYKTNDDKKPVVLVDSHSDEVGFMVQSIRPDGLIEFVCLGGFVPESLPNSKVNILNDEGMLVEGIISTIPPHYHANSNDVLNITNMTIDVGASSSNQVKEDYKISLGNFITPSVDCKYDSLHGQFFGKAFDCRIGVSCMVQLLKELKDEKLDVNVCGALVSQEEVGERGAFSSHYENKSDVVICFEGCPCDDTFTPSYKIQTALNKGPMIRYFDRSIIASPRLMKFAKDVAKKYNIPLQEAVRRGGGNNGAIYTTRNNPAAVIVIGVPVRYIHTPNCITTYSDYRNSIELAKAIIKELNSDVINNL